MRKEGVADVLGKADRCLCRKVLSGDGADQTDHAEGNQNEAGADDDGTIALLDADIDDLRHDQRNEQLERGLQQLEQRAKDTFFFIGA